jgi:hypothetical protein
VTTARQRGQQRRKDRQRRAAARRLPPVHGNPGRLSTGGRARPVRVVGVGRFAEGMARRSDTRRRSHGWRRVSGAIGAFLVGAVLLLVLIARLAGHL